ncbi:MAG: hypothetical protein ILM98_06020 [Kiritimatiellae bacterium]|nr:hypothetical protein [Kiritimatiellia bacterium]
MNKVPIIAVAAMAAALPLWAEEVEPAPTIEEGKDDSSKIELSVRAGVIGDRDASFIKTGPSLQLEARFTLFDSCVDLVGRGYYAQPKAKKGYSETLVTDKPPYQGFPTTWTDVATITDSEDGDLLGGSAQLQLNFARNCKVNPYVVAGVAYEKEKLECDIHESLDWKVRAYGRDWPFHYEEDRPQKWDEDGTAFVGRVGCEFDLSPFWFVAEGSYMTKLYDSEDKGQFELAGRAGFQWTKSCRIDAGIDYYTEWEQFFVGLGLTLCL